LTRALVALLALIAGTAAAQGQVLDAIVARVDDGVITWSQVLQELELRRLEGESQSSLAAAAVLEFLVRRRLFVKEAEKLRLDVDSDDPSEAVNALAATGGEIFWERVAAAGLSRTDLVERARRRNLAEAYLDLRREMTFVPVSEIRRFHAAHPTAFGDRPLADVREEVRVHLAAAKYERELSEWLDRQVVEGRVRRLGIPQER
jgi:hypothetical protein